MIQVNKKGIMAEQIAKVALLRTGLVTLTSRSLDRHLDIIAYDNRNLDKIIGIVVTECKREAVHSNLRRIKAQLRGHKFRTTHIPIIAMFIDSAKESGYFTVLNSPGTPRLAPLKMDVFTSGVRETLRDYTSLIPQLI